jgi:hypothetical protein
MRSKRHEKRSRLADNVSPARYNFDHRNLRHWCFDDCPEEELFLCWHYEYLRDCPSVVEKVLEWREKQGNRPKISWESLNGHPHERLIMEWPEIPYMERDRVARWLHLYVNNRLGKQSLDLIRMEQLKREPVAVFPILDWKDSKTGLIRKFKEWLDDAYPKDVTPQETRGRRTMPRTLRPGLKALGAYRLSRVMSQEQVISHAIEFGKPLYKNQPELSRVLRRTKDYLSWLDQAGVS